MNSPTTNLLTSIQQMKNKLKNDKELLQDIKKDFNLIKPKEEDINYYPHYRDEVNIIHNFRSNAQHERDEKKQFAQRQKTVEDNYREPMDALKQAREAQSIDSTNRSKRRINELKKEHREQIRRLEEANRKEKEALIEQHQQAYRKLQQSLSAKIVEQANYIAILEEQVGSPIQSERGAFSQQQYDHIVNKLLRENTVLLEKIESMNKEILYYSNQCRQLSSNRNLSKDQNSSRLLNQGNSILSKIDQSIICLSRNNDCSDNTSKNHEVSSRLSYKNQSSGRGSQQGHQRCQSRFKFVKSVQSNSSKESRRSNSRRNPIVSRYDQGSAYNDENIDTSNREMIKHDKAPRQRLITSICVQQTEDEGIQQDQAKMRTIRGFVSVGISRYQGCMLVGGDE